ncbi:MAG: sulfite exporter TauE/SafE family protein [Actinomycetota bacterium]|nr:sulfite exporter TauE/SafE family protein [Actinomycetota bacterium]
MTAVEIIAGGLVYAVGCTIQGVAGFGANLFAVPILALINPEFVPGPVLMVNPLLSALLTWRERGHADRQGLRWSLVGRMPGIAIGVLALGAVTEERLGVLFGVLLLLAVALRLVGIKPPRTPGTLASAGCLSGFMGTTVGVGGPPIALLYQDVPGPLLRATMSPYFLVGTVVSVTALAASGHFGVDDLVVGAFLVPAVLLGVATSKSLRGSLDRGWVGPAVYVLSSAAAVALLVRSLA